MMPAPGPHHRLTGAEALALVAGADRATLLKTVEDAVIYARQHDGRMADRILIDNHLLVAAAALHLALWGALMAPGQEGRA